MMLSYHLEYFRLKMCIREKIHLHEYSLILIADECTKLNKKKKTTKKYINLETPNIQPNLLRYEIILTCIIPAKNLQQQQPTKSVNLIPCRFNNYFPLASPVCFVRFYSQHSEHVLLDFFSNVPFFYWCYPSKQFIILQQCC